MRLGSERNYRPTLEEVYGVQADEVIIGHFVDDPMGDGKDCRGPSEVARDIAKSPHPAWTDIRIIPSDKVPQWIGMPNHCALIGIPRPKAEETPSS